MLQRPILIVDDSPANLAILRQILEPDYRLIFAQSGVEALALITKVKPSLILLDIQMPDMSGYQVCQTLKSNPETESIPIIFVTSLSDQGNEETGFTVGCVDYLSKPVVASLVKARVRTHLSLVNTSQLEKSQRDAVFILGEAGHYKDNDTGVHIWRMAAYSRVLAEAMGWSKSEAELLSLAAPMHDTGKIGIPDAVLTKPGKLNAQEWSIMQQHCQIGYQILSKSDEPIFKLAATIALNHHEQWNGNGYPKGLTGVNIPESARIVAIADVFDALTMQRSYKAAWPLEQAYEMIIKGAVLHFDPTIVECFINNYSKLLTIKEAWEH